MRDVKRENLVLTFILIVIGGLIGYALIVVGIGTAISRIIKSKMA